MAAMRASAATPMYSNKTSFTRASTPTIAATHAHCATSSRAVPGGAGADGEAASRVVASVPMKATVFAMMYAACRVMRSARAIPWGEMWSASSMSGCAKQQGQGLWQGCAGVLIAGEHSRRR